MNHKDTKTLRKNHKIKSFVSLCLSGKNFLVSARQGCVDALYSNSSESKIASATWRMDFRESMLRF